jgi:uncharacterized protein (TIGR02246 family)
MKSLAALCSTAALALMMSACNQAPPDTHDADVKAINDIETAWNADYAAKDADKAIANYADDAVLMEPGSAAIVGKTAITPAIKGMVADPAGSLQFHADKVEVSKSGDLAFTYGHYTMTMTDPATKQPTNDHGSYVTTYRKGADGAWKAVADIATSAVPPAAAAPAAMMMMMKKK